MQEDKSSYRQIMKATSLFGGVQVFNILIAIVRSKFVAILLGPAGMGVVGLLQSTLGLVTSITNFGLRTSAVKDIAAAVGTDNLKRVAVVVAVMRKLVWFTGLLGAVITIVFSSWLSKLAFGNTNYTSAFIWLSITLLFYQLSSGQSVLLQGFRKLKPLAKSSVFGSFIGLLVTVPIYYFYGEKGIVPVLIISSITTLMLTWYFSRKVTIEKVNVDIAQTIKEGKQMMILGFMISLSGLLTVAFSYAVRVYINKVGGLEDVGLYGAGFAIITTYVGLVFSAMATDYYPRLSGVSYDNNKANQLINQQAEIGILILAPILTIFIIFINWVVIILYSTKFIPVNGMIHWAALGMYFKVVSWAMGFLLLAKGASKLFFWNELIVNIYMLGLNLLGYYFYGLDGLGISFFITYVLYFFQIYVVLKYKYKFHFDTGFYKIFGIQLILGLCCFIIIKFIPTLWAYVVGVPFILFSVWYSYRELDTRLNLKEIILNFRKRK
ncbi:O-antigen translocase [Lutibacter sp. A64]|uniref:O-antigen translocase n=1 Tax=Lutibacter sp. A64 TaxID=2918526 RepID=UPI001F05362D|nr:O-antigen translocase [Lutibacter sp. A64]UMB55471.1 O-antigen translocase [Lutibacter sp. A64]